MWPVKNSSALIGGKYIKKNPLEDLLSSVNAVISTNEKIEFITDHMTYNPAYTWILQTTTTMSAQLNFSKIETLPTGPFADEIYGLSLRKKISI